MVKKKEMKIRFLWLVFFAEVIFIGCCNFFLQGKNIDSDMARLYVHAIEIYKNHNLYIPNWNYVTTAEWDCTLLFAVPFYAVTKNIYLSFAIANMIFLAIWIWTVFKIFSDKDIVYPLVTLNLLMIPYGVGMLSYFNMLFFNGGQYVIKVLLPLMLTAILLKSRGRKLKGVDQYLFIGIYSAFLLVTAASSGIYVFLCGLLPCLLAFFVYSLCRKEKPSRWSYITAVLTVALTAIGYYLNIRLQVGSKGNEMKLCVVPEQLHDNIVACFWGLFELFEGVTYYTTKIMSYEGIMVLLRMLFTAVLLVCAYTTVRSVMVGKKADLREILLVSIFLTNFTILCLCDGMRRGGGLFEYRYHLIGAVPLLILSGAKLIEWYRKSDIVVKRVLSLIFAVVFTGLLFGAYRNLLTRDSSRYEFRNICHYAAEQEVRAVYFDDYEAAEICRLLDNGNGTEYIYFINNGADAYTYAFDYYRDYSYQPVNFEGRQDIVLVVYSLEEKEIIEMLGQTFRFLSQEGAYGVYVPLEM